MAFLVSRKATTPRPYLYLPDNWDATWRAAKANSSVAPVWMTTIADSIGQGVSSSNFLATSWFALVRAALIANYPTQYADFYHTAFSSLWQTTNSCVYTGTPPWVINGTGANADYTDCYGGGLFYWTGNSGTLATFTTPYACTDMDLYYYDHPSAGGTSMKYTVDGGADVTITHTGAGYIKKVSLTSLANTTHVIVFKSQSTDFVGLPVGVATYKSRTVGIGYANISICGGPLYNGWQDTGNQPSERPSQLQGKGAATTGFGFPMQPSLAIIAQGINDNRNGVTTTTFFDGLRRMVQGLRRGQKDCSIIIMADANPDAVNSDMTSGEFTNSANWAQWVDVMDRIARIYNCAFVNIHAKWGETPVTQGFIPSNDPHPLDAGYADMAAVLNTIV